MILLNEQDYETLLIQEIEEKNYDRLITFLRDVTSLQTEQALALSAELLQAVKKTFPELMFNWFELWVDLFCDPTIVSIAYDKFTDRFCKGFFQVLLLTDNLIQQPIDRESLSFSLKISVQRVHTSRTKVSVEKVLRDAVLEEHLRVSPEHYDIAQNVLVQLQLLSPYSRNIAKRVILLFQEKKAFGLVQGLLSRFPENLGVDLSPILLYQLERQELSTRVLYHFSFDKLKNNLSLLKKHTQQYRDRVSHGADNWSQLINCLLLTLELDTPEQIELLYTYRFQRTIAIFSIKELELLAEYNQYHAIERVVLTNSEISLELRTRAIELDRAYKEQNLVEYYTLMSKFTPVGSSCKVDFLSCCLKIALALEDGVFLQFVEDKLNRKDFAVKEVKCVFGALYESDNYKFKIVPMGGKNEPG